MSPKGMVYSTRFQSWTVSLSPWLRQDATLSTFLPLQHSNNRKQVMPVDDTLVRAWANLCCGYIPTGKQISL